MMDQSNARRLYDAIDRAWERAQLQAFGSHGFQSAGAVMTSRSSEDPFHVFLFGRLLQEDLHVSCSPRLPPDVAALDRVTLEGVCVLQVLDVVNIGANVEKRTEDSKGPTRTLKLALTDGHQIVYGFEHMWLPQLSTSTKRGTKVLIKNANVRHGLLLLTPHTCQVLGASGNPDLELLGGLNGQLRAMPTNKAQQGAYAAAVTSQLPMVQPATASPNKASPVATPNAAMQQAKPLQPPQPRPSPTPTSGARSVMPAPSQSNGATTAPVNARVPLETAPSRSVSAPTTQSKPSNTVKPPVRTEAVFLEISSDEAEGDSDTTDPAVQHLFYSPKTPRIEEQSQQPARKKPRPDPVVNPGNAQPQVAAHANPVVGDDSAGDEISFSLLGNMSMYQPPPTPQVEWKRPFRYFSAKSDRIVVGDDVAVGDRVIVRACIKSVAGFQFNSGKYDLQVLIEDGTANPRVAVDPAFVEQLMGVSCGEFVQTMQSNPALAHKWAAQMQFRLMTLEGLMTLRRVPAPQPMVLENCRKFQASDALLLLQRVQAVGGGQP
ncbi:TPA: hypothetical protein N0F65_005840 [Lagenidium giganteum]|uniref:RecQ-mediated genome instability protein 1 n=1 Tax=Lagenidium giganteum TaxID=4803 RepID=A0AAV2YN36_9STRA|nr:TPA: hypothetical protein N0F65_005840 [Lagenidium giganteum]